MNKFPIKLLIRNVNLNTHTHFPKSIHTTNDLLIGQFFSSSLRDPLAKNNDITSERKRNKTTITVKPISCYTSCLQNSMHEAKRFVGHSPRTTFTAYSCHLVTPPLLLLLLSYTHDRRRWRAVTSKALDG